MGATLRHWGVMRVRSATAAPRSDPMAWPPPVSRSLPGRYMTGEPFTTGLTSTIAGVYASVSRSSRRDTPESPDMVKNRPVGSTKLNGYLSVITSLVSTFKVLHVLLAGEKISG